MIFLLLQLTHNATESKVGVANPYSQYVQYLPGHIPLPTSWDESERVLLEGTSLEAALDAKLKSLDREFRLLRDRTYSIAWCKRYWWDAETGQLTVDDWKYVDAAYRSRALDLPGTGHATVPCIDMANHASDEHTIALYETDAKHNAILVFPGIQQINACDEVTITYGDDKGACEMLFSYGFIEDGMSSAKELFLDLDIPDDDPLKIAKKAASRSAPGFRLFAKGDSVEWEGPFVWLLCVNEEDGLEFKVLQSNNGEREIILLWKEQDMEDPSEIRQMLLKDVMWDVFQLRAIKTLQIRIEQQLFRLEDSKARVLEIQKTDSLGAENEVHARRLRDLEEMLMLEAYEAFEHQKTQLLGSPVIQKYLGVASQGKDLHQSQEDFS